MRKEKKRTRKGKKIASKEAYLKRLEMLARKALAKSKAEIEEGLTTGQRRHGREKPPSAYRETR